MTAGPTHSEGTAEKIDPATRQQLIDDLAEQARNGGARARAEAERLNAEWLHERRLKYDPEYCGSGFGDFGGDGGGGGDCGGGGGGD